MQACRHCITTLRVLTTLLPRLLMLCSGAAPFFMSQRAVDKLKSRKTKPATYNLDLNLIAGEPQSP